MAATVVIKCYNGAAGSEVGTDITGTNLAMNTNDDAVTSGNANPIKIPSSGQNYSFWKCTRLEITGGTFTQINNVRWYTDGANSFGTGVSMRFGSAVSADYTQATGTIGETGVQLTAANWTGGTLNDETAGAFIHTGASPYVVGSTPDPMVNIGDVTDYVVIQLAIDGTATAGVTGTEALVWLYDEV